MTAVSGWLEGAVEACPGDAAVVDAAGVTTYAELFDLVEALGADLAARGVGSGDRVAILSKNRVAFVALLFAAEARGAVALPLNWRLTEAELSWILDDAAPAVLYAEAVFEGSLAGHAWVDLDEPPAATGAAPESTARAPGDEPILQMYTSGTSGRPKGALLTGANWRAMIDAWAPLMELGPGDRFLQVTPLFHVGGVLMAFSSVARRSTLHLLPEFDPVLAAEALEERRITHTLMVPAMIEWLLAEPSSQGRDYEALRLVVYGAAPMRVATLRRAGDLLGADFLQGYGLTESAGVLTALTPEHHRAAVLAGDDARLASAGRVVDCAELRVVDAEGADVQAGAPGEVIARGGNVTPGYWKGAAGGPDAQGWFATGDVGVLDEEGFLSIVDRAKDMILVGGENVYPREVERVLLAQEGVTDAAVIGVPHAIWGEAVHALVVTDGELDQRALLRACRAELARFKCPERIERRDALPRNAAGKLLKRDLRAPIWKDETR